MNATSTSSPATPKVFVVDDDPSVRLSLSRLLASVDLEVETFSCAESFLSADRSDARGCAVLDVKLPQLDGLELQRRLADARVGLPIIFLTGQGDIPMSVRAMKAGAVEFMTKPFQPADLIAAVRDAIERDRVARIERDDLAALTARYESLTAREREVMRGVVAGQLNKQIAAEFGTREATVKEQRAKVMEKMRVGSVAELVRFALRLGHLEAADEGRLK
ncbi:response regulator [Nannocystis sp. RBIL2]|uniref:response regulator transcription factor n=1 Tax=Nannocystis sp. RBIL2 TaxID=2996788 RepID=UPI00226E7552|nr:response regulator [Nannocystis sp. RBIL2]MCY1072490.1 response regulator [Nannocystis sp. RBIL2]